MPRFGHGTYIGKEVFVELSISIFATADESGLKLYRPELSDHEFIESIDLFVKISCKTNLLNYKKEDDVYTPDVFLFCFNSTCVPASNFIDVMKCVPNSIAGLRAVWFDSDVSIHLDLFQESEQPSFLQQQQIFFDSVHNLVCGFSVFTSLIYGDTCGHTQTLTTKKNQILLLPSPCSFKVCIGASDVTMATMFFPSSTLKDVPGSHGLTLFYDASTLTGPNSLRISNATHADHKKVMQIISKCASLKGTHREHSFKRILPDSVSVFEAKSNESDSGSEEEE